VPLDLPISDYPILIAILLGMGALLSPMAQLITVEAWQIAPWSY
jgi:hypothetical protein